MGSWLNGGFRPASGLLNHQWPRPPGARLPLEAGPRSEAPLAGSWSSRNGDQEVRHLDAPRAQPS